MQAIQITDGRTSLWQWDTGVSIKVYGCTDVDQMHFVTPGGIISRDLVDGECNVPDTALQTEGLLKMYAFDRTENGGVTRCDFLLMVKARPKPADYIDPPDEYDNLEELAKRVAPLIPGGGGSVTPEQIGDAVEKYLAENPVEGKPGPQGPPGADGSDATVTAENVTAALGYTPADKKAVDSLSKEIVELKGGSIVDSKGLFNHPLKRLVYPDEFSGAFKPLDIFYDKNNVYTDFAASAYVTDGTDIYCTPNGNPNVAGTDPAEPTTLEHARKSVRGKRLRLSAGVHYITDRIGAADDNFSVIGEDGTFVVVGSKKIYTHADGVWTTECSSVRYVFDVDTGLELSPTDAVENVDRYSYHYANNVLTFDVPYDPNDRIIVVEELTNRCVMAYAKNSSNSVFVQNVTFVGGGQMIYGYGTAEVMANIVCDDVRALYGTAGCNATYCKVLLHKSRFDRIAGDAISYAHCDYFEFDTVGANCTDTTSHTSNGSTAHNGCKGVRAGCTYYNNEGANVADTANCESVCVCCKAAYSCAKDRTADNPGHSIGFIVEDNTKMWLINCEAVYNAKDLSVSGSTSSIYASGCAFNSQAGVSFV